MTEAEAQAQAFELLASKFPKRYGVKTTVFLRGLLEALATGDGYIETQVEAVRDNLIAITASGRFLDRTAGLYGIIRGQGTGVLDPDFRKLIPLLGLSPKQISHVLMAVIDTIYGPFASHANATSSLSEPFDIEPGFTLKVRVDDGIKEVTFGPEDAIDIHAASAEELATAISKKTGGRLIGSTLLDARTGKRFLNIRTSTIGSQGFLQVLGGDAQSKLEFPEIRPITQGLAVWETTRFAGGPQIEYKVSSGPIPNFKSAGVSTGDLVTIRSDSGFTEANTGNYTITAVGTDFFRVNNGNGVPEASVSQTHLDDFTFYKPDLGNILLTARPAAILETAPRELTVILPVTSPIVKRSLKGGHHFHQGLSSVLTTTSNTMDLASISGLTPSGAVRPILSRLKSHGIVASITSTTVTMINAQKWPQKGSFWVANLRQFFYYSSRSSNTLSGVSPTPPSELVGAPVEYVEKYRYSAISGNTLTGVYPDPSGIAGQEVAGTEITTNPKYPGSFLFDPTATFTTATSSTVTTETIRQGSVKTLIRMGNVGGWPDKGHFVFENGTATQEGPIRYLAKVGSTGLIVDPGHVYERDHLKGVGIRLVRQIGPYTPKNDGSDYAVYTTSTAPARDLLASYLRLIAASGVRLRFVIRVPDQKWEVLPNLFTTHPLDTQLVTV